MADISGDFEYFDCREYENFSDGELARRSVNDPKAAAQLVIRMFPYIRAVAYRISPDIADDLVQEGLLSLLNAASAFDETKGTFKTYAVSCAKNRMLTAVKPNSLLGGYEDIDELSDAITETVEANGLSDHERLLDLYEAMERCLSNTEKSVITCYISGCSYREIAVRLSMSEKSVDNALQRARRKLREELLD